MIGIILGSIGIVLDIVIIAILLSKDGEERKLTKTVALKSLKLKERAIDMQIANTAGFLEGLQGGGQMVVEEEETEERTPVGYGRGN